MPKVTGQWEKAILSVLEQKEGVATLKDFYEKVPNLISQTKTVDSAHSIRGFLRRLKTAKGKIKQIGLSTYALVDYKPEPTIYEEIQKPEFEPLFFNLPKEKIHDYVEGMLIEIGNLKKFQTYTPDKSVIFNDQPLSNLITYNEIPPFTYPDILSVVKQIDVIWFRDKFPAVTFDIENSTDYVKAFDRASHLKYFKSNFYMVGHQDKKNIFNERQNRLTFKDIKDNVKFVTIKSVFDDYKNFVLDNKNRTSSLLYI